MRRDDLVPVADVPGKIVLLDHLAHVRQDLGRGCDWQTGPRLEAVAKRVQIAVGADAWIAMGPPRAAEALLRVKRDEALVRTLLFKVIGGPDAGNPGADDHHVEVLGQRRFGRRPRANTGRFRQLSLHFASRVGFYLRRGPRPSAELGLRPIGVQARRGPARARRGGWRSWSGSAQR